MIKKYRRKGFMGLNLLLSVVIAFVGWFYVAYNVSTTITKTYTGIPITYEGEYDLAMNGLGVVSADTETISVTVKISRTDVIKYSSSSFTAKVDVSSLNKGSSKVSVTVEGPNAVSIKSKSTDSIVVETASTSNVDMDVYVGYIDGSDSGTEPIVTEISYERVSVIGAKEIASEVAMILLPVSESILSADETTTFTGTPIALDADGNELSHIVILPSSLRATAYLGETKTVPLTVEVTDESEDKDKSYEVPTTVTIKGEASLLEEITELTATAVDITDITEDTSITLKIKLPDGVELANESAVCAVVVTISQ